MLEKYNRYYDFDPTSTWENNKYRNQIKYSNYKNFINKKNIAFFSASVFEISNNNQILTSKEKNSLYLQFRDNLHPEIIEETVKQLKKDEQLLHLASRLLAFHLIALHDFFLGNSNIKIDSFDPEFYRYQIICFHQDNPEVNADGNLSQAEIEQIIEHLEETCIPKFENNQAWKIVAETLLIRLSVSAVEKMQLNLGLEAFNSMNPEDKLKKFLVYLQEEDINNPKHNAWLFFNELFRSIVVNIIKNLKLSNLTLNDLNNILGLKKDIERESLPIPITEGILTDDALAIPCFAPFKSAITAQVRPYLWKENQDGFAYLKHQAKSNSKNYIEHYISNSGDIELLPLEQAEQIIDKFGFNTVKLHLIFAAHTMNQEQPWNSKFSLKASDVIKYVGWDKRTDLPAHQKLNEIAKAAYVLDCLLVKSVWVEGRNKKGGINASTPTGRMWNVVVDPRGELNIKGKVEKPEEVYITVQPGLIFHSFLNKAGSKLREALYQFGYLAQDILKIDPYHDELALRLAIHLTMESRVHTSGTYRVETLLKHILPHTKIDKARNDTRRGYDLKQRWDNALKLLKKLKWQIQFDKSYPEWLQPRSKLKKPANTIKMKKIEWLLQAKITIQPPEPIPELISAKVKPKRPSSKKKKKIKAMTGITSDQIRKGRNALGWSQRKLAGRLGVTQTLVGYWEKGKRTPSETMEIKLRQILEIID